LSIGTDILAKLTSWYPCDGNLQDAHGLNDIDVAVTAAGYSTGKVGQCLDKLSDGYTTLHTAITVDTDTAMTIGGWFYFDGTFTEASIFSVGYTNAGDVHNEALNLVTLPDGTWAIGSWATTATSYVAIDPNPAGLKYDFVVRCEDSLAQEATSAQSITIRSVSGNPPGWYFAVGTWEGVYLKLYVNGEFVVQTTPPRPANRAQQITLLQIGNQYAGALTPCACDELFFCDDDALTADEIAWLYNSGAGRAYGDLA
jgi:hypothetical protein